MSGPPRKRPTVLGKVDVTLGSLFPTGKPGGPRRPLLVRCWISLGEGRCDQCVAAPLILLMLSYLVSVLQRCALASPACHRNDKLPMHNCFSIFLLGWLKSEMTYIDILMTSLLYIIIETHSSTYKKQWKLNEQA